MAEALWSAVERYFSDAVIPEEHALTNALQASAAANLPAINVAPVEGMFLRLLAQIQNARRILEIGTLGGYSTLWLAGGLAGGGKIVTLEYEPRHARVAKANFENAGVADRIELRLGPAIESLDAIIAENVEKFDLVFIDADKVNIPAYYEASLKLARPGTLIVVDNVVRQGNVIDSGSSDASVFGVRKLIDALRSDRRVNATALQTVGSKGYDGFALLRVK